MRVSMPVSALIGVLMIGVVGSLPTTSAQEPAEDRSMNRLQAEAEYVRARLARVNAELALNEFIEKNHGDELGTCLGELALAQSDLERAEDRVIWSGKMLKKGFVSVATCRSSELAVERARFELEQARAQRLSTEQSLRSKAPEPLRKDYETFVAAEVAKRLIFEQLQRRPQP